MTGHKLFWHLDRVVEWQKGLRIAPLHIDLGVTSVCNINCRYCYGKIMKKTSDLRRTDMSLETMHNLFMDCKQIGVRSIALTGEGENTLNPDFYDAIKFARDIKLDLGLATNGVELKSEGMVDLLSSLVYLRFNISAATKSGYKIVHGVNQFEKVIDNIKKCVRIKKEMSYPTTIGLQMVIIDENFDEIVPLAELGQELGVDYLVMKPCSDSPDGRLHTPHKKYLAKSEIYKTAESFSTDSYSVIVKWKKLANEGRKPFDTCRGTQFMIAINSQGDVAPCGHFFNPAQKEQFTMGNINEMRLKDIVFSDRYWEVQRKISLINVNSDCESNCKQYYISSFLDSLANPPDHINFP